MAGKSVHLVPIVVAVAADSYEAAQDTTLAWALRNVDVGNVPEGYANLYVPAHERDNVGQRVIYLDDEREGMSETRARLRELEARFEEQGGRGVELADEIDALRAELGETEEEV